MILAAFDTIISRLEAAQPLRLAAELKDFRNARTSDDLRIVRSELVAGGMLAAAGVGFDFGARGGTPQPDLVLRETSLGIEIKNRTLDGLRELERNLDDAVADLGAPVTIYLTCDERRESVPAPRPADLVICPEPRARHLEVRSPLPPGARRQAPP
jgi:hypothetical protein